MRAMPVLPMLPDGSLPPLSALIRWFEQQPAEMTECFAESLPEGEDSLPDLLALAGIEALTTTSGTSFTWRGVAGGQVVVNGGGPVQSAPAPTRRAEAPALDLAPLLESLRVADAAAVVGRGSGAVWAPLLAVLDRQPIPAMPPLMVHAHNPADRWGAWNPLPMQRTAVVALPATGTAPRSLIDEHDGAQHPVQVCEGARGCEVLAAVPIGALEARRYRAGHEPAPGTQPWEVSADVLDNGLVRAEFDLAGRVERLCLAGRFVELSGVLGDLADGHPGPTEIRILEDGPVRARLGITRATAQGTVHLTWTLHAGDPCLHLSVDSERPIAVKLATAHRHLPAIVAGETAATWVDQRAATNHRGLRWLTFHDGHGSGLTVAGSRPFAAQITAGTAAITCAPGLVLALGDPLRVDASRLASELATPLLPYDGEALAAPFRLVGTDGVAVLWVSRTGDACELLLAEQRRRRVRLWLFTGGPTRGLRCDVRGQVRAVVPPTPEGDGLHIDLAPGEIALIRWMPPAKGPS